MNFRIIVVLAFLSFILIPSLSFAGGDFFPVIVSKVIAKEDKEKSFIVEVSPLNNERIWMDNENCSRVKVSGYYDFQRWKKYKRPRSIENHIEAIEFLRKSKDSNQRVYLGFVGDGLIPQGKCNYQSKGLFYLEVRDKSVVFSINGLT